MYINIFSIFLVNSDSKMKCQAFLSAHDECLLANTLTSMVSVILMSFQNFMKSD